MGEDVKGAVCVWPGRLGEDATPAYKYSRSVNTGEGANRLEVKGDVSRKSSSSKLGETHPGGAESLPLGSWGTGTPGRAGVSGHKADFQAAPLNG